MTSHVLAIDQGTTSSRAIVFRADCTIAALAQQEIPQHFPQSGWVEHDPEDLWRTVLATGREAIAKAGLAARDIAAIGITNQRETTLMWDRATGNPIYNAIVWQDRRTAAQCRALQEAGHEALVAARTGLRLVPISPPPRSHGCWSMCRAHGRGRNAANSPSAPSIRSCCGG